MSSLNSIRIFNDGSVEVDGQAPTPEIVPTSFPWYGEVIQWHVRYGRSYIAQRRIEENNPHLHAGAAGDPAVFQLLQDGDDRPVHITPSLEQWMFDLMVQSCRGNMTTAQIKQACRNAWRDDKAYFNGTGWNNGYQSIILGENIGSEPQKLQLTCANGHTVKVLGPKQRRPGGKIGWPVEVMNAQDPNTILRTLADSWWMMFPATVSTVEPAPEGNVDPFPYHGSYDVIIPMLANNTTVGWIEEGWIRFLPENTTQPKFPYYRTWFDEAWWKAGRGLL